MTTIRRLSPKEAVDAVPVLTDILIDCVEGGASVSFQPPLDRARLESFWRQVAADVGAGSTILLVGEQNARIVGTVQVQFAAAENQPHRGEIAKMLVARMARRGGVGAALLQAAESEARAAGKTLLTLDTQTGSAGARLYTSQGWIRVGEIPGFALKPGGGLCATTIFYKALSAA